MTDPIPVTLSGNSTPLLPTEQYDQIRARDETITSLRARLAEAENSRDIARGVADAFRDTISRETGNPDAVHGLMILCQSHKKLAEAEARAGRAEEACRVLHAALKDFSDGECHCDESERECVQCCADKALNHPAARAAVEGAQ